MTKQSSSRPRLMLIGHTYMVAVNREKAVALSRYFEVMVCTFHTSGWMALGEEAQDEDDPNHVGAYELKRLPHFPNSQNYTVIMARGLGREMKEFQPDFILVENEPWSLLRWQARILSSVHASKAVFAEFSWENVERQGLKNLLFKFAYCLAGITAGKVIAGNQGAARFFEAGGVQRDKILIDGQLGSTEKEFPRASIEQKQKWRRDLGWDEHDFVIGFCGRIVAEKGLFELAKALHHLRHDFPHVRFALLGAGPIQDELRQLDPGQEWMRFFPPVPHREVCHFLNKIDLFVLPSKPLHDKGKNWEEQFGHVLIEAIFAGAMTIGSDSGAIAEVLADESKVFQHSSEKDLTRILQRILSLEPAQREVEQAKQREVFVDRWSHAALAKRYAEFIKQADK